MWKLKIKMKEEKQKGKEISFLTTFYCIIGNIFNFPE